MRQRSISVIANNLEEYIEQEKNQRDNYETEMIISKIRRLSLDIQRQDILDDVSYSLSFKKNYFIQNKRQCMRIKIMKIKSNYKPRGKLNKK